MAREIYQQFRDQQLRAILLAPVEVQCSVSSSHDGAPPLHITPDPGI